jgi:hypothetical protein
VRVIMKRKNPTSDPPDAPTDESETEHITEPLRSYEQDTNALFGLVVFVGSLITRADEVVLTAAKALVTSARDEEERERLEKTIERGGAGARQVMKEQYARLFAQLVFQRVVDDFLSYISQLLRLIFATRPEALRSSESVRLEEILRYETMDELVRFLVERRVDRLAYLSVEDLADDLQRLLGIELFESGEDLQRAAKLVAIRNLIAHNRGLVNQRFLRLFRIIRKPRETRSFLAPTSYLGLRIF